MAAHGHAQGPRRNTRKPPAIRASSPSSSRYFAHQLEALPSRPLRDWGKFRWQDNALAVIWLYNRTGDPKLLDLVRLLHQQGHDWQAQYADFKYTQPITPEFIKLNEGQGLGDLALSTHGVNNGQAIKAAPVWWLVSGQPADRAGVHTMLAALDKYHGLPNGMFSCDEHFAGRNPSQGSELCTVVETMFSLEQSLAILGDAAARRPPGKARLQRPARHPHRRHVGAPIQSGTQPGRVQPAPQTLDHRRPRIQPLRPRTQLRLLHRQLQSRLAQVRRKPMDGLRRQRPGRNRLLAMRSPHRDRRDANPLARRNRLSLPRHSQNHRQSRIAAAISASASHPRLGHEAVNPRQRQVPARTRSTGSFARIDRTWKSGDIIELDFPMQPRLTRGFNDSISIERGPLVSRIPSAKSWVKLRDRGMTADWQVFPASGWNYALAVNQSNIAESQTQESPIGPTPFALKATPIRLEVNARKLPSWRAVDGVADPVPPSPVSSDEPIEKITLLPYAAAKLRIIAFPQLKIASDG